MKYTQWMSDLLQTSNRCLQTSAEQKDQGEGLWIIKPGKIFQKNWKLFDFILEKTPLEPIGDPRISTSIAFFIEVWFKFMKGTRR